MHLRSLLRTALAALAFTGSLSAQADVGYRFASPVYNSISNFTGPCTPADGVCETLSGGEHVRGSFTTALPLAPNRSFANILPLVKTWKFSNGTKEIQHTTPGSRVAQFFVATDAAGNITESLIQVGAWNDGGPGPHAAGERFTYIRASDTSAGMTALNGLCATVTTAPLSSVADTCTSFFTPNTTTSWANYPAGGAWELDTPRATIANATARENEGNLVFTVTLDKAPDGPASLNWHTADGTARAGSDYTASSGTLTWASGDGAPKTITVPLLNDALAEPAETFTVVLDGFSGTSPGASTVGVGSITDDDAPPPAPATQPVPTLAEWALLLLSLLTFCAAWLHLRLLSKE